ncbi:CDP-glycerol glycerophosphotransferase family protein [Virgibacillus sp. C22-A2]|uniref:CDP-glycerol glycerophosphotransferase family protein n=1 Tax=Virgibacillus tibetensis TaxID=3042313 RepID=A0ABU6KFF1_9BACI|nr:CDP-glycerol glycerophosphotransferase family protein [Virgibacillus sp. C22-A2]
MIKVINRLKELVSLAIIYIFNCLPIKHNKIFLFSYYGSQYGCSPKYITKYIVDHYPEQTFDLVWAFNDPASKEQLIGVRKVKTMSLKYFYELCTSKVVITNFRTTNLFVKRKRQYYIQTWHSSLRLKQIEKDTEDTLPDNYVEMAKKDSRKCDLLLSGCSYSTDIFRRSFWYEGEIFEQGIPRNDVLFEDNVHLRHKILKSLGVSSKANIILYAPTFRKDNQVDIYNLDYEKIIEELHIRFGGNWTFLVKLHPHLISQSSELVYGDQVIDVTEYDDIQELLGISDVLITDYSSLMFDYALTGLPCFLYVPDVIDYLKNDRKLYFNLTDLPFYHATTINELLLRIESFDSVDYRRRLQEFSTSIGSYERGRATEYLLKQITEKCFNKTKEGSHEAV